MKNNGNLMTVNTDYLLVMSANELMIVAAILDGHDTSTGPDMSDVQKQAAEGFALLTNEYMFARLHIPKTTLSTAFVRLRRYGFVVTRRYGRGGFRYAKVNVGAITSAIAEKMAEIAAARSIVESGERRTDLGLPTN